MKTFPACAVLLGLSTLMACNKSSDSAASPKVSAGSTATASSPAVSDGVQQKLQESAGTGATDCGRLDVHATADQSKTAADCAMQANQSKHAFYVAYDMPGMAVGVAGNAAGKLFTVQSQGTGSTASLTSGDCPSELRVASSGRITCFAPGDMGSMGAGHTAGTIPPGMSTPHSPTTNPHATGAKKPASN